jgi:Ca-activated chloride channel family protein
MRSCCIRLIGRPGTRPQEEKTLPVRGVGISVLVKQDVAAVSLSQVFVNDGKKLIEVEYVFPIPSGGTLSALKIWLHGKVIQAQVKEKEEAKEQFADALASGDNAFMAQISELEDVATLQIGVIKAGEEVRVEVTYVVECKFEAGRWRLLVPLAMIPRYQSSEKLSRGGVGQTWSFACSLETSVQSATSASA